MTDKSVKCGKLNISNKGPFTLIAGPCQLENEKHALDVASELNCNIPLGLKTRKELQPDHCLYYFNHSFYTSFIKKTKKPVKFLVR